MKKIYNIKGMHCVGCESLLTEELKTVKGIKSVRVSHVKGSAEIEFEDDTSTDDRLIEDIIKKSGYILNDDDGNTSDSGKALDNTFQNIIILAIVGLALFLISKFQISKFFPDTSGQITVLTAIGIGIVASLSTCLALTGGLIIGFSAKQKSENEKPTLAARAKPQIFFHAGRLSGFFVMGGALGILGDSINYSLTTMSLMAALVAVIMLYLGLNIMGIVPDISRFGIHLPKSFAEKIKKQEKKNSAFTPAILGALTFFLPCGFTQSMQLLAVASGSFLYGGLIMFFFALGTLPVLFSLGLGTTFTNGRKFKLTKKFIGALIIFFALFSLNNAFVLAGSNLIIGNPKASDNESAQSATKNGDVQIVKMDINYDFVQTEFNIIKDVPVRWEINAIKTTGCSNEVIIPRLGLSTGKLKPGLNVLEFTPTETGILPFSCWMGMLTGRFIVSEGDQNSSIPEDNISTETGDGICTEPTDSCDVKP